MARDQRPCLGGRGGSLLVVSVGRHPCPHKTERDLFYARDLMRAHADVWMLRRDRSRWRHVCLVGALVGARLACGAGGQRSAGLRWAARQLRPGLTVDETAALIQGAHGARLERGLVAVQAGGGTGLGNVSVAARRSPG